MDREYYFESRDGSITFGSETSGTPPEKIGVVISGVLFPLLRLLTVTGSSFLGATQTATRLFDADWIRTHNDKDQEDMS